MAKPAHYRGSYARRSRELRARWNADPQTECWRCGQSARHDDPWQAGHVRDGDPTSPLLPEHRSCNARAGQALTTKSRYGNDASREW